MRLIENRMEKPDYTSGLLMEDTAKSGGAPYLIKSDGNWLYKGDTILQKSMVCLFASLLARDEGGQYYLDSPAEKGLIVVEDTPFVVVAMKWRGVGRKQEIGFLINTDEYIAVGCEHGIRMVCHSSRSVPVTYLHVRDGKGTFPLEARINRATYYELVALAELGIVDGHEMLGVWSGGIFFPIAESPHNHAASVR